MGRITRYPGVLTGALFYAFLFAAALAINAGFSVMGVQNAEITKLVLSSFWPYVVIAQAKLLLAYLFVGALIGLSADVLARCCRLRFVAVGPAWIVVVTGWFLAAGIRAWPQLYTETLYDRGGLPRQIQMCITHVLPAWVVPLSGVLLAGLLGAAAVRTILRKPARRRVVIPAVVAAALALALGRSTAALRAYLNPPPARPDAPSVLIIAADSLRQDAVGRTRHIAALAEDSVVFTQHYTSLPRTFPAVISLLTGKLPVTHGVRHMFPSKDQRDHRAGSIPDILRRRGYTTAAVSDFAGDVFPRFDAGFETVRAPYFNFVTLIKQRSLEVHFFLFPFVTTRAGRAVFPEVKEMASNGDPFLLAGEATSFLRDARGKPFFEMVFFSTLHFPYAAPDPYYRAHTDPAYRGRFKYHKPPILDQSEHVTPQDVAQIRGLYDGAVDAVDDAVGEIVAYLKGHGLYDSTMIILTADHGENLYENNWHIGHGEHLRGNNVLNIPLMIKFPLTDGPGRAPVAPRTVTALTRDIDVAPTVCEYLGCALPPGMDGVSIMPLATGASRDLGLIAFAETGIWFSDQTRAFYQDQRIMYPDITGLSRVDFTCNLEVVIKDEYRDLINTAKHRMVDDGRYRLIYAPTRAGVIYELYDRRSDPGFTRNIASVLPATTRELRRKLEQFMSRDQSVVFINGFSVPRRAQ